MKVGLKQKFMNSQRDYIEQMEFDKYLFLGDKILNQRLIEEIGDGGVIAQVLIYSVTLVIFFVI